MTTKTMMLSTDSDSSSRYAAKYSVAAVLPWVAATHRPSASPSPTHTMTHAMFRDEGTPASVEALLFTDLSLREAGEWFLHDSAGFVSCSSHCVGDDRRRDGTCGDLSIGPRERTQAPVVCPGSICADQRRWSRLHRPGLMPTVYGGPERGNVGRWDSLLIDPKLIVGSRQRCDRHRD